MLVDNVRTAHGREGFLPNLMAASAIPLQRQQLDLIKVLIDRCASIDQPTSALLSDLRRSGLLEETLVLFGSEFGRLPTAQGPDGRDHNITGYSMFLAGAGVKPGFIFGGTDEYGIKAV